MGLHVHISCVPALPPQTMWQMVLIICKWRPQLTSHCTTPLPCSLLYPTQFFLKTSPDSSHEFHMCAFRYPTYQELTVQILTPFYITCASLNQTGPRFRHATLGKTNVIRSPGRVDGEQCYWSAWLANKKQHFVQKSFGKWEPHAQQR